MEDFIQIVFDQPKHNDLTDCDVMKGYILQLTTPRYITTCEFEGAPYRLNNPFYDGRRGMRSRI